MLNQKSVVRNKSGKVKENCLNNTISDLQALLSSGTSNSKSDMQIRERGGERLQLLTESLKTLRLGSALGQKARFQESLPGFGKAFG
jgi:hypothetical protein